MAEKVIPSSYQVEKVKYYTARVSGAADPDQPRWQQIYFKALQTVPGAELYFGKFLAKTVWRLLMNLLAADHPIHLPE